MKISGIDELRQTYSKEIVVELQPNLADGRPWAVKLRQVRPIVYIAVGESLPVPSDNGTPGKRVARSELLQKYDAMRALLSRSVSAVREVIQDEDGGDWREIWTPVEVLFERQPEDGAEPRQMHIDEIDIPFTDNVTRCWNALYADAQAGGRLRGTEAASFPAGGSSDALPGGEALRDAPPRVRAGQTRRAGVRPRA